MKHSQLIIPVLLLLCQSSAFAQTADPAYANMQRAVGGIIQQNAVSRGFSTVDPRTYSTLYGVGRSAVTVAAGAGAGLLVAGTAPAWGTLIAAAAVGAAVSYGVTVGIDGLVKWKFGSGATPVSSAVTVLVGSGPWTSGSGTCTVVNSVNDNCVKVGGNANMFSACLAPGAGNPTNICLGGNPNNYTFQEAMAKAGYSQPTTQSTSQTDNLTLLQAVSALTTQQKAQQVSYDTMALMINDLWKKASQQSDYTGIPYVEGSAVTPAQVQAYAAANPSSYPSVESMVAPVSNSSGFAPSTSTAAGTATTPAVTAPSAPSSTQPFPTDYSRENTQAKILAALDGTGMPTSAELDQNLEPNKVDAKNAESTVVIGNITQSSVGLFNWFPVIPTAQCEEPKVPNPITGVMLDVPVCGSVSVFSKFITAVICFFCLIGCVHQVQSALKA